MMPQERSMLIVFRFVDHLGKDCELVTKNVFMTATTMDNWISWVIILYIVSAEDEVIVVALL